MFEMKPEYYIGIDMIDQEHKQLFDYASEAYELLQEEFTPDKYDKIDAILEKLRDYTVKHFSDEEEYMKEIGYPKLEEQMRAHEAFIDKLVHIDMNELDAIDDNQQDYLIRLIDFLLTWLSNHILKADKQIGKYAATINQQP